MMNCPKCGSEDVSLYATIPSLQFFLDEDGGPVIDIDDVYNAVEREIAENKVRYCCGDCYHDWIYKNE